jgi:hypothetical protein
VEVSQSSGTRAAFSRFDAVAEILVRAANNVHADPNVDARAMWKRGMMVAVKPDGHIWGAEEVRPAFVYIKIPLIDVSRCQKYLSDYIGVDGEPVRRRLWQIRVVDMPAAARNKLANTGQLIIKATADYTGAFDYTWAQVKEYFRNLSSALDETEDL